MAVDLGLYVEAANALVLGDLHLGYEESLHAKGVLVPRFQLALITERLNAILDILPKKLDAVVINGDLKHEFGRITGQEWKDTLRLVDNLRARCKEILIVKGNHDLVLGPVLSKRGLRVVDEARFGKVLIVHGDAIPSLKGCSTVIIGHEHPAVGIKRGSRLERFKCFLKGRFHGKTLIVVPSFQMATEGTDVLREDRLSPFLQGDLDSFEAFLIGDRVYPFGTLARIRGLEREA